MKSDRISKEELIKLYQIEVEFFQELESCGLIQTRIENEVTYLLYEELGQFERLLNFHYDLEVNVPGLEIITRLLTQIESLQSENRRLMQGSSYS
ncbi:chaperone modulator CbpM [Chryseobacterium sp. A321]